MPPTPAPGLLPHGRSPTVVAATLDPVLIPLGFAAGQVGGDANGSQVIFCRGERDSADGGCVDLVVEVEATPAWHITDVRYWGFSSDRWRLDFIRDASIEDQLAGLTRTLPSLLG